MNQNLGWGMGGMPFMSIEGLYSTDYHSLPQQKTPEDVCKGSWVLNTWQAQPPALLHRMAVRAVMGQDRD